MFCHSKKHLKLGKAIRRNWQRKSEGGNKKHSTEICCELAALEPWLEDARKILR